MNKNILILGKGYIGQRLQEAFDCNISDKRINNFSDAEGEFKKYNPKIIINCIGSTGVGNVDGCEEAKDKTLLSNTFVPIVLGDLIYREKIKLVHISSGCIYNFNYEVDEPITEKQPPDYFKLFYSRSKIYAERALQTLRNEANILIVRIRIPLDDKPHPKNIFTKILSFKKIIDAPNSVTYIPDFIKMIEHLVAIDAKGIYNTVNKGGLRYQEILEIYKKFVPEHSYELINYKDLGLARTNMIMSVKKLEKSGFKVRDIHEIIEECVTNYLRY